MGKFVSALIFAVLVSPTLLLAQGNLEWFGPEPIGEKFFLVSAYVDDAHRTPPEEPVRGTLSVAGKFVEIFVIMEINCEPGFFCPAIVASPLYAKLPVTAVTDTSCGNITIAERDLRSSGGIYEKIKVVDYRNVTCKIFIENLVHAQYTTSGNDQFTSKPFSHTSSFEFSPKFKP